MDDVATYLSRSRSSQRLTDVERVKILDCEGRSKVSKQCMSSRAVGCFEQ